VVAESPAPHTGHMAADPQTAAFVAGAAGFIGSELVKVRYFLYTTLEQGLEQVPRGAP
jgi:hypothetical protein